MDMIPIVAGVTCTIMAIVCAFGSEAAAITYATIGLFWAIIRLGEILETEFRKRRDQEAEVEQSSK